MTQLKVFSQTSDLPYDRHFYRIVFTNGKGITVDDYEQMRAFWFQYDSKLLSHVDVLDAVQYDVKKSKKSIKGFGG